MAEWEPVIGLEIHVQLKTRTKMFCRCENVSGDEPNTRTCPICLAHPGTLPIPNRQAIEWTIKLGVALGCDIAPRALFHRKHYVYPDLAKSYQISQYDVPLCTDGRFVVPGAEGDREIGIVRAHLEEDAAKTIHVGGTGGRIAGAAYSLVDFNRGGTPLVEIVTQPDVRSPDEARRFLQLLRQTVVELGISDAEMEKGSLRCDANVSVREAGEASLRTKTELKNMNSFKFVADGIAAEVSRQIAVYDGGGHVVQQTLHYDPGAGAVSALRSKEEADDYRYFPEPDLVPVEPDRALVGRLEGELPELPGARIRRLERDVGLALASELVSSGRDALLEPIAAHGVEAKTAANFLMNDYVPDGGGRADPTLIAETIKKRRELPPDVYRQAAEAASLGNEAAVAQLLAQTAITDTGELEAVIDEVLAENVSQVAAYRGGKGGVLGFFVGQVMKKTQGKADPRRVNELLREKLDT
ncbi:MAG: Asp-tRNA(Asn)/Glu-tRNA(Gln) amidotransferase subunit GatB [Actinomycetota bacterium]|nr:Asp-tRNA(Asn)/Glu-tRNA(Gln) amidotransferase subunit GatB [Actinomycetota bacterium]